MASSLGENSVEVIPQLEKRSFTLDCTGIVLLFFSFLQ